MNQNMYYNTKSIFIKTILYARAKWITYSESTKITLAGSNSFEIAETNWFHYKNILKGHHQGFGLSAIIFNNRNIYLFAAMTRI